MHFLIISLGIYSVSYLFCSRVYCVILPINTPVCVVEFSSRIILCLFLKWLTRAPLPHISEISQGQNIDHLADISSCINNYLVLSLHQKHLQKMLEKPITFCPLNVLYYRHMAIWLHNLSKMKVNTVMNDLMHLHSPTHTCDAYTVVTPTVAPCTVRTLMTINRHI